MRNNSTIKSFLGFFVLLVFTYSITPKIVLHNIVANHIDSNKVLHSHLDEVSASGVNCKCDNLVAESPFTPEEYNDQTFFTFYNSSFAIGEISFSSHQKLFSQLRGPPVV